MSLFNAGSEQLERRSNIGRWQLVRATFETANQDVVIRHSLPTPDPEQVSYQVLNITGPSIIYHDGSATRASWGNGFIRLRANIVTVSADILLTVSAANVGTTKLPAGVSTTPSTNADTLDGLDSTSFARANASFVTTSSEASLTNESVLTAGTGISIVGATISATGAGSAPSSEAFVTIGNTAGLSAERALTAGTGLALTDGGANSTATLASTTQRLYKTADQTVTASTVLVSDTHLTVALASQEVLALEYRLLVDADATGDLVVALNVPAGAAGWFASTTAATATLTDAGLLTLNIGGGAGVLVPTTLTAYVDNAGNAGSITLRWAQSSASGATVLKIGSAVVAHRLA